MQNTNLYKNNYNAYQPALPLDFTISYDIDIPEDDILRTVKNIVDSINLVKYIDFSNRDTYGYNAVMMFECVILGKTIRGYVSVKDFEEFCHFDTRFQFITQDETPSFMSFERVIKDNLTMPIEDDLDINVSILYIDGSKFETNANKMTFVWKKATQKYYIAIWEKCINLIKRMNKYFKNKE